MAFGYENPSFAAVDISTATTTAVVAAQTGKRIKVLGFFLVAGAAQNATWKSAATALTGSLNFGANGGIAVQGNRDMPLLQTASGEALNLTTSAAAQLSGSVTYVVEADTPTPGQFKGA